MTLKIISLAVTEDSAQSYAEELLDNTEEFSNTKLSCYLILCYGEWD